ncbi:MAG: hypothetical protein LBI13_05140 [Streptococcaceae bacterium]|nr:hypothetical protein [Streptococcaceae bacterium]
MKKIGIIFLGFITLLSLTACGGKKKTLSSSTPKLSVSMPGEKVDEAAKLEAESNLALQRYVANLQPNLAKIKTDDFLKTYSDLTVTQNDAHTATIIITFAQQLSGLTDSDLGTIRNNFKGLNQSLLDGMTKSKVTTPKLMFVVNNADGTSIINEQFTGS